MISERLKTERESLGLSQQALADRLGISLRSQQNYEKGDRNPDSAYLAAIAAAGADVLYILTGQRSSPPPEHDAAEQVLLDSYQHCNAAGRQHLIQTAALLSAGMPVDAPTKARAGGNVKVSSGLGHAAGRDVNVNVNQGEPRNGRQNHNKPGRARGGS